MDNFEEFLRKEAQGFKMQPSDKVWKGVRKAIAKPKRVFIWWYGAAALFIVLSAAIGYYNYKDSTVKSAENTNKFEREKAGNPITISPGKAERKSSNDYSHPEKSTKQNGLSSAGEEKRTLITKKGIQNNEVKPYILKQEERISIDETNKKEERIESNQSSSDKNILALLPQKPLVIDEHFSIESPEKAKDLSKASVRINYTVRLDKFSYSVTAGINLSKPVKINYNDYVKAAVGFGVLFATEYHFTSRIGVSAGIGYQQNKYRVGAAMIAPETIYLRTSNGLIAQTAQYRLYNETLNNNITRQILVPLAFGYKIFLTRDGDITLFTGADFAKTIAPDYLIKNSENDRLFTNNKILNPVITYLSFGLSYHHKITDNLGWLCSYKAQYQSGNTYKKGYGLKEHILTNGINLGIVF